MAEIFSPFNVPESSPSTKCLRASAIFVVLEFIIATISRSACTLPFLRYKDALLLVLVLKGPVLAWPLCFAHLCCCFSFHGSEASIV